MRVSRFFTEQELAPGDTVALEEGASRHVLRVLRLRPGDPLVLFNGDGADYAAELTGLGGREAMVTIHSRLPAAPESPLRITLVQAISRGERMDQTLQKAAELGVMRIQPVMTERVAVRLQGQRLEKRLLHWRSVLCSACAQCGRARVPELAGPLALSAWLGQVTAGPRLVLDPGADQALSSLTLTSDALELLVGPEGGLSDQELDQAVQAGVSPVRLGPRTLRTETAGPAAVAVLQAIKGDF